MTKMTTNSKSISRSYELLESLIGNHLESLDNNDKKILEICHTGKFLLFFENIQIKHVTEKPDFILFDGKDEIGLEHQIIVDSKSKEKEGFFQNIFSLAEIDLKQDTELPNFLADCYIMPYANFKLSEKDNLIQTVKKVIKEYVLNDKLIENPIIESISNQPHSQKNIHANMGGWWQKNITKELIENAIKKKESKISSYRENGTEIQWLLLVIGSSGDSSFEMDKNIEMEIETEFDKVFILEDLRNTLYELK